MRRLLTRPSKDLRPLLDPARSYPQNIRRGHYELGTEEPPTLRVMAAFTELVMAI